MSKPAIVPEKTTAGIAVDPRTLQRVVPESRRPDGTYACPLSLPPPQPSHRLLSVLLLKTKGLLYSLDSQ
jgi:hypothetical protein